MSSPVGSGCRWPHNGRMVQSIEFLVDDVAEQRIRGEWARLIAVGLPSQGRHTGASNRPHITIAVGAELTADDEVAIAQVVEASPLLPVSLGGGLVFGARTFVLARSVIPSVELLTVQQRVTEAMGSRAECASHQSPGRWTPHITLARRLSAAQVGEALDVLSPIEVIETNTVAVRRWDSERRIDWLIR